MWPRDKLLHGRFLLQVFLNLVVITRPLLFRTREVAASPGCATGLFCCSHWWGLERSKEASFTSPGMFVIHVFERFCWIVIRISIIVLRYAHTLDIASSRAGWGACIYTRMCCIVFAKNDAYAVLPKGRTVVALAGPRHAKMNKTYKEQYTQKQTKMVVRAQQR